MEMTNKEKAKTLIAIKLFFVFDPEEKLKVLFNLLREGRAKGTRGEWDTAMFEAIHELMFDYLGFTNN